MRNGYQDLGSQDGDTTGKQAIGDRLFIDDLNNYFGVRLNVLPFKAVTNALEEEPGDFETRVQLGNPDWIQLFVAGSVFKNVSIWIENELSTKGELHISWFRFGFHNLVGQALNAWVGILDPLELHAANGRLPMIPPARSEIFFVKTSGGKGDDSLNLRGGRPAIAVFGSAGPLVYEVGVENGATLSDPNTRMNLWGTLRLEATSGPIEGSSVSVFGYLGEDTKKIVDAAGTFTGTNENDFWRISPAANLRLRDLDVIAAYVFARDDNYTLAANGSEVEAEFQGVFLQAGHPLGTMFHLAAQYDGIWSDDDPKLELQKLALALSFQPRENWRIILMPRFDLQSKDDAHPRRQHEVTAMIRTMF
ncbi:MAG: hypothetical protein HY698_04620 [Deltaproteobacteria bacterium]|nr:hypothetical protein [Deltaproteobacteria bacterium]